MQNGVRVSNIVPLLAHGSGDWCFIDEVDMDASRHCETNHEFPTAGILQQFATVALFGALLILSISPISIFAQGNAALLFHERCDDIAFAERSWYDNTSLRVSTTERLPGSTAAIEFRFNQGAATPVSGGAVRRLFDASATVYLSYWVKYSDNWQGSNRPYHPHEFHFLTNADDRWIGPAYTHLTAYIEHNEGRPLLAIQDSRNIDESNIGVDLANVTEYRAVAGCNGSGDFYPPGDCYRAGATHRNGKMWKAASVQFSDEPGPRFKGAWRFVEALISLNSIVDGKGIADGLLRMWIDGELVVDAPDAMLRTGKHPSMAFNQFLIAPYIGDGAPVEQTMWVDEIVVATGRMAVLRAPVTTAPPDGDEALAGAIFFSWKPVAGAMRYELEFADDAAFQTGLRSQLVDRDTAQIRDIPRAGTLWWRVRAVNPAGRGEWSEARHVLVREVTAVENALSPIAVTFTIAPHPASGRTGISMTLPHGGRIRLHLYSMLGRCVHALADGYLEAGLHRFILDASVLPPGLYLLRCITATQHDATPMLITR
jgi:hypothetical protein